MAFQHLKGGEMLFTRACSDRSRGNDFNLKEARFSVWW